MSIELHYVTTSFPAARFAFSSKERDTETGLSYFGARYYSSDLSIWLSVDPMSGKYPHQSNYVYCSNNPLKVIDPNGEDEWELARDGTLVFYHSHDENHTGYTYVGKDDYDAAEVSFKRGTTRVGIYMAGERCYYMFEERTFPNGTFYFIEGKTNERKSK